MGCCFSKKRKKHPAGAAGFASRCKPEDRDPPPPPSPEEEKVKEVLSETPNSKVRAEAKPVANVLAVEEQEVEKAKATGVADAAVSDLGSCVSLATDQMSEVASDSSVATSAVGPEQSPGKPVRKRPVSGELGLARRDPAASPAPSLQRKPPVPARPSPRRVQEAPPPLSPPPQPEEHAVTAGGDLSIAEASAGVNGQGDGDGKESLENPLVSLECFIFL